MRPFLQKYIRPILKKAAIYDWSYKSLFSLHQFYCGVTDRFNKKWRKTALIFTYHRIATVSYDPHLLCVTPKNFDEQINFFYKNFEVVSLRELKDRLRKKNLKGNEAVITLDDGYIDNFTNALPILEKYNVPATIFVTTSHLGKPASFSWDREYTENDRAYFLNDEHIKILSNHPLIEIGAHTHTHPRLADLNLDQQLQDISQGKEVLEKITHEPVTSFAYPFGGLLDYNRGSKRAMEELGFELACTTIEKSVTNTSSVYNLPRFNMRNYSAVQLKLWYK